uniref:RING finger protein 208 n=1 Tax=Scatophagus argus TaxID=75038 RepID=UPI001ED81900|nr:RING finger protein 208 [Scatophagus argus]
MNPYEDADLNSHPCDVTASGSLPSPPPYSPPDPYSNSPNPYLSATLPSPPVIQTGHSYLTVLNHNSPPYQASSSQDGHQTPVPSPDSSTSSFPASDPGFRFSLQSSLAPVTPRAQTQSALNPYHAPTAISPCQVSVIVPSPDLSLSPLQSQCSEDTSPDLECSICFSQFNNIFRCPKMLQCQHTFCLECLARINVKSAQPSTIQCPLCRSFTPLPSLGLPRLATDSNVLSYLPAAMQRVYSIRFVRSKGKLQVKRSSEGRQRWGQRSLMSLRSANHSLNVGLPSPPVEGRGEVGGALFRLTGRPACRAFLLTSVVMMMLLLTGIIIFLIIFKNGGTIVIS